MNPSPSWDPQQVLGQLSVSRQDLLSLMDHLMAGLESEQIHVVLAPTFGRLYRRMVAIIEEEREFLEKMNHPEQQERAAANNRLAKQVALQYQAFKKAQSVAEQGQVAAEVIAAISGFTVQNSLLWDRITRDLQTSHQNAEQGELVQAEAILAKIGIPSPPRILLEISKEMKKAEPDIGKISGLIREDPGLSAKVISMVNSPLYGLRIQVKSINHAVTLLGLKLFQRAVFASSLRHALAGGQDNKRFEVFWQHSVIVARAAEFIAIWLKDYHVSAELAYMAGLFHDCAIPPLMAKFPKYGDLFGQGAVAPGQNIRDLENTAFETNHCVVGYLISKSWGLAPELLEVIRYHHHATLPPQVAANATAKQLWYILRISELFSAHLVMQAGGQVIELSQDVAEDPIAQLNEAVLTELGIGREDLRFLLEDLQELANLGSLS